MTSQDDKSKGHDSILDPSTEPTLIEPIDPLVGRTLGKYQLISHIAQGGTATVYRAVDTVLNREVAVKILHEHLGEKKEIAARFKKEAQLIAQLRHPNVLTVFDFFEFEGRAVLVVEYMPGITLSTLIKETSKVPEDIALVIGVEILEGLKAAHEKGITHRDVKPANVLLHPDLGVKISDFGLAKIAQYDDGLTKDGIFVGTPSFSSPEQIEGRPIDARSDIFSFGLTLYILATRQHAFKQKGDSTTTVWFKTVKGKFEAVRNIDASLSPDLERVIGKCLQVDVAKRYGSAQEVILEIREVLARRGLANYSETLKKYLRSPGKKVEAAKLVKPKGMAPRWFAVGGVALVLGAALMVWWKMRDRQSLPTEAPKVEVIEPQSPEVQPGIKAPEGVPETASTADGDKTEELKPAEPVVETTKPKDAPKAPVARPVPPPEIPTALLISKPTTKVILMSEKSQSGYRFQWSEPSTFLLARDSEFKSIVQKYTEFYTKVDVARLSVGTYFWKMGRADGKIDVQVYRKPKANLIPVSVRSNFGEVVDLELNPWTQKLKLDWSGGPKASTYVLEVAQDAEFKNLLFRGALVQTQYSLERNFEKNQTIFWRVSYEDEGRNVFYVEPIRRINLKFEGHSPELNLERLILRRPESRARVNLSFGAPSSWSIDCQKSGDLTGVSLKRSAFLHSGQMDIESSTRFIACRVSGKDSEQWIILPLQ